MSEEARPDELPEHNLLVSTPAYSGMVHTDYVHTLLSCQIAGVRFSLQTIGNESLITRARNAMISNFWSLDSFSHLLFIDGDVFLDSRALMDMIAYEVDVVGAAVSLKGKDANGYSTLNTDADVNGEEGLVRATRVGTGVLMLSRRAVGALVQDAIDSGRTYRINATQRQQGMPEIHYDIFRTEIVNNEYLSEDFWLCHRLTELGFPIHVDTGAYTRHNGMVGFD